MPRLHVLGMSLCLCAIPVVANAQAGSLFGQSGGTRASGPGNQTQSLNGSGTSFDNGGSRFGNTGGGMFGNAGGGSSLGGSGLGQGGLNGGQGGLGGNEMQTGLDLGGATVPMGQNAFIGRANAGSGFVGDARIGGSQFGAGPGGFGGGQGFFGGGGRGGFGGRDGGRNRWDGDQGDDAKATIRPTLKIGFDVPGDATTVTGPVFAERFARITERQPNLADVTYVVDGSGRVVLNGTVPNEDARGLAKALFRLEPGVHEVIDELSIAGAETE